MRVSDQVKEESRRALVAAAARAFAERGYHGAGIDEVSVDAGLAKGTVYNYFPSKRAIFEAVLLEACRLAAESADAIPADAPAGERLRAFVAGNLVWGKVNPGLSTVFARALTGGDEDDRALLLDAALPCIEKVAAILGDGAARGELRFEAPPRVLAITFLGLANTLLLQSRAPGVGWPAIDDLPAVAAGLFLDGLRERDGRGADRAAGGD